MSKDEHVEEVSGASIVKQGFPLPKAYASTEPNDSSTIHQEKLLHTRDVLRL